MSPRTALLYSRGAMYSGLKSVTPSSGAPTMPRAELGEEPVRPAHAEGQLHSLRRCEIPVGEDVIRAEGGPGGGVLLGVHGLVLDVLVVPGDVKRRKISHLLAESDLVLCRARGPDIEPDRNAYEES